MGHAYMQYYIAVAMHYGAETLAGKNCDAAAMWSLGTVHRYGEVGAKNHALGKMVQYGLLLLLLEVLYDRAVTTAL